MYHEPFSSRRRLQSWNALSSRITSASGSWEGTSGLSRRHATGNTAANP